MSSEAQFVWHKRRRCELDEAVHSAPQQNWGFKKEEHPACNFVHESRIIRLTCHGDDFIIVVPCKVACEGNGKRV